MHRHGALPAPSTPPARQLTPARQAARPASRPGLALRGRRGVALAAVVAVVAACGPSEPSASAPPAGSTPAPVVTAPPTVPGEPAAGATSGDRITAAYEAGTIDRPAALLYRLQAAVGDDRLPEEFRGEAAEDDSASALVLAEWESFTDAEREAFIPYVVRPTDPRSIWVPGDAAARAGDTDAGAGGAAFAALAAGTTLAAFGPRTALAGSPAAAGPRTALAGPRTAAACQDGFVRQPIADIPVVVWGQCGGATEAAVLGTVGEVARYVEVAWWPLTALMGDPIGDANVPTDVFPDAPEGDDGLLDIYVVAGTVAGRARTIASAALATTHAAGPLGGTPGAETTSSYIVVNQAKAGSGDELRSTLVHELFHSLSYAHNNIGTLLRTGGGQAWERHWFMEASATWAEHEFVPGARSTEVYPRFENFQGAALGLWSIAGNNEYDSWVWPYFMRQEAGPEAIADAWRAMAGIPQDFDRLQDAIGQEVGWEDRFRDFAVRAYNAPLDPGDPIDPRFQADDASFPDEPPSGPRAEWDVEVPVGAKKEFRESLPGLWARYVDLVTDGVPTLELDLSGLTGGTKVTVDLLIKTETTWQRRPAGDGPICDAERVVVVLANAGSDRSANAVGTWTAEASDEPCNDGNWQVTLVGSKAGAGTYSGRADRITCFEDEAGSWSFDVQLDRTGDIRLLGGNAATLQIITRFAMDDPIDWGAGFQRKYEISVTGDKSTEQWTVHAEATWHDTPTDSTLSSTVDVVCSEQYSFRE